MSVTLPVGVLFSFWLCEEKLRASMGHRGLCHKVSLKLHNTKNKPWAPSPKSQVPPAAPAHISLPSVNVWQPMPLTSPLWAAAGPAANPGALHSHSLEVKHKRQAVKSGALMQNPYRIAGLILRITVIALSCCSLPKCRHT